MSKENENEEKVVFGSMMCLSVTSEFHTEWKVRLLRLNGRPRGKRDPGYEIGVVEEMNHWDVYFSQ